MSKPRILAFSGSARKESFNKRLLKSAIAAAREAGAEVTIIDLDDYPSPMYHGDLEETSGIPEHAKTIKHMMIEHDGFLLATAEYNSSITPLLKNTIDWASRKESADEGNLIAFQGKVAGLISASPGALGGLRALNHVRDILGNIGVIVIPKQQAVPKAHEVLADDDTITDDRLRKGVEAVGRELAQTIAKLKSG